MTATMSEMTLTNLDGGIVTEKKAPNSKKTAQQQARLEEFKSRIKDIIKPEYDDPYLRKWLIARQYDVTKAEKMIRDSMLYRERMNVDTILEHYTLPEVLQTYLAGGYSGYDREGSPVRVELFGRLDIKGLMYSTRRSDLEKSRLLQCERTLRDCQQQAEKLGRRVDGQTVLFDMDGVGMGMLWKPGLTMYLHLVKVMEDNYPEMMKRMFVINAPWIFPLMYKICRPMVSDDMKNKIHVLGGNYMATLIKYIDADQIPKFLGGTKTDPDGNPNCLTMISQGGKVPESYYLTDQDLTDNMETAVVPRGERLSLPAVVHTPGSILRWEFKTEGYDITFGVWRVEADGQKTVVVCQERVDSHIVTQDGSFIVDQPGEYVVVFDNSFSWTKSKRVKYIIEVLTNVVDEDTRPELEKLISLSDWNTLMDRFETTHF